MAFRLGILAAIVAYRRRNGKTRLKTLQQSLKNSQHSPKIYQFPAKKIFSIVFLITLIIGMQLLVSQLKTDFKQMNYSAFTNNSVIIEPLQPIGFPIHFINEVMQQHQKVSFEQQFIKINYVVKVLQIMFAIAIFSLLYDSEAKVVTVLKIEKKIICKTYTLIKLTKKEVIQVMSNDRLVIHEMGDSKITKTDYYFSVRLLGEKKDIHIIKKSCIFDARVAVIKLAHQLQIPFSTKIIKINRNLDQQDQ